MTVGIAVVVVVVGGGVAVAVAAVVVVLQVCGECEGDGLKTSERARRKRRVRSAESKIQSMEEQRLHGFGPLRSETHFVQHGESAVCV